MLTLFGASHGHGALAGRMVPLGTLRGKAAGSSQAVGNALVKTLIGGLSAGHGGGSADLTLLPPTIFHIIITGQSNGVGNDTALLSDHPPKGLMFSGGLKPGLTGLEETAPLAELTGTEGQTLASAMVNWLATHIPALAGSRVLVSNVAVGGQGYNGLKKGTTPYGHSIAHVAAAKAIAEDLDTAYKVLGVVNIHGEFDDSQQRSAYRAELVQWQSDYEADIQGITGQVEPVRMYAPAQAGAAPEQYNNGSATLAGASALNLLGASLDAPDRVVMLGPLSWCDHHDGLHLNAASQSILGEMVAAAIKQTYFDGVPFVPLYGIAAERSGSTVVVDFHVPTPPIRWDFRFSSYKVARGFTFRDSNNDTTVIQATITGDAQVTLLLSGTPTGTGQQIRYQCHTWGTGAPRYKNSGNLADSAVRVGAYGLSVPNYACSFLLPLS